MIVQKYTTARCRGRFEAARRLLATVGPTTICVLFAGCDPGLPYLRFGTDGLVRVTVEVPLEGGGGLKQQVLTWNSDGAWTLYEEIGYDGVVGDQTLVRSPGMPMTFAANYQSLLHVVNDDPGTSLWSLGREWRDCGVGRSRVSFLIRDDPRDEQYEWTRCAAGANSLGGLKTAGVEPDDRAARVVYLAMRTRDLALGKDFGYAYTGSLIFATIEKGTQTDIDEEEPRLFRSDDGAAPGEWLRIWDEHKPGGNYPQIDWATEMVVLATAGARHELGDSIEARKVLLVGDEWDLLVEVVRRVPGDYCAPARRDVRPYHVVVTPRREGDFSYSLRVERVACGV